MRDAASSRMTLERHLRRALDRDEFHVVYQPVVDIADASIVGMEALLRWHCPDLGPVSPADFIPIAERTGLILPIGRFVLARAVEQLAVWQAAGHDVRMSVNLSASQLTDEQLPDLLVELLETHGAPAERLLLELTETALMRDTTGQPLQMLERLRTTGAGLVLDDFGTGYSSLARLSSLRLAAVKIDRSFIAAMETDVGARAVVTAVMQMAGPLRCAVVAEGIETAQPARPARGARLPARPGLPLRPPRPGGRGDRDARRRRGRARRRRVAGRRPTRRTRRRTPVPALAISTRPSRTASASPSTVTVAGRGAVDHELERLARELRVAVAVDLARAASRGRRGG